MKTRNRNLIIAITFIAFLSASNCFAQDWAKRDAKNVKSLVDTTLLRASEVTLMPGEKSQAHTHPAHFFYALTDLKLVVHYTDGKEEKYNMAAGESGYSGPERPHWVENVSDKPGKFLLIELKEHPYKMATK